MVRKTGVQSQVESYQRLSGAYENYVNAELDKTEMLLNFKNRTQSTEIEYYQEIWKIKKKKKKKKLKAFQNIDSIDFSLFCFYI